MKETYHTVPLRKTHNTLQRHGVVTRLGWTGAAIQIEPGRIIFLVFALVLLIFSSSSRGRGSI